MPILYYLAEGNHCNERLAHANNHANAQMPFQAQLTDALLLMVVHLVAIFVPIFPI